MKLNYLRVELEIVESKIDNSEVISPKLHLPFFLDHVEGSRNMPVFSGLRTLWMNDNDSPEWKENYAFCFQIEDVD